MTALHKIALIGGGKMGEAIMGGLISSQKNPADQIQADSFIVANPGLERRCYLQENYGVCCVEDGAQIDEALDLVIIAVKPQVCP